MISAKRKMMATNKFETKGLTVKASGNSLLDRADDLIVKWWNRFMFKRDA